MTEPQPLYSFSTPIAVVDAVTAAAEAGDRKAIASWRIGVLHLAGELNYGADRVAGIAVAGVNYYADHPGLRPGDHAVQEILANARRKVAAVAGHYLAEAARSRFERLERITDPSRRRDAR